MKYLAKEQLIIKCILVYDPFKIISGGKITILGFGLTENVTDCFFLTFKLFHAYLNIKIHLTRNKN